jgi:hypothetical protein
MVKMTREQREARIERDDGDPDDVVFLSSDSGTAKTYHERRDCRHLQVADAFERLARGECWRQIRAPCKTCVLAETAATSQRKSLLRKLEDGDLDRGEA